MATLNEGMSSSGGSDNFVMVENEDFNGVTPESVTAPPHVGTSILTHVPREREDTNITLERQTDLTSGPSTQAIDTQYSNDLEFFNSSTSTERLEEGFSGSMDAKGHEKFKANQKSGTTSRLLDRQGFGWLLEVEEDENEPQKPLLEELDIDPKDIYYKIRCVLLPIKAFGLNREVLRENPDFWGPLLIVLLYSIISVYGQFRVVSWVITIWLFGSFFVFALARVLGGEVGYSQTLGILGYSLLPLLIVAPLVSALHPTSSVGIALRILGVIWSTFSAGTLLAVEGLRNKKPLLLYPLFLVYVYFLSMFSGV